MRLLRFTALVLSLAAPVVASVPAASLRPDAQSIRWKSPVIKIYASNSLLKSPNIKADSDVVGALRQSLAAWSDAANVRFELEMTDRASVSPAGVSGDGLSLITIAATPENVLLFSKEGNAAAAKTRVFFNKRGAITEADVVLSPFQQFSTDGSFGTFDLQTAITHEIGHLLGLKHSDVLGSMMAGSIAKNASADGVARSRGLADSDISAVRDIYGTADILDDCCSAISGRLTVDAKVKNARIWAEEKETGRVVAQTEIAPDGSFRMGGISAGTYRLFARSGSDASSQEIAELDLRPADDKEVSRTLVLDQPKVSLELLGTDGRLASSAIIVSSGSRATVFVAGKGLDARGVSFMTSSPYFHIDDTSVAKQDAADGLSVISFNIAVDAETPRGIYSLFATSAAAARSVLIGALRVD